MKRIFRILFATFRENFKKLEIKTIDLVIRIVKNLIFLLKICLIINLHEKILFIKKLNKKIILTIWLNLFPIYYIHK